MQIFVTDFFEFGTVASGNLAAPPKLRGRAVLRLGDERGLPLEIVLDVDTCIAIAAVLRNSLLKSGLNPDELGEVSCTYPDQN